MLFNGPKIVPSRGGSERSANTWFLGPIRVYSLIGISVRSAIFAGPTTMTNRQTQTQTDKHTDRPCYSISSKKPHLAIAVMRPNNLSVRAYCKTLNVMNFAS